MSLATPTGSRPLAEVLQDIVANIQSIVRSEVRLVKTEFTENLMAARSAAVLLATGMLLAVLSAMSLMLTAVETMSLVMPRWAATLLVAIVVAIAAGATIAAAIRRFKIMRHAPDMAANSQESVEWARQQLK